MKKTTTLLLSILMLFSTFFGLIACANDDKNFDINSVTCIKLDLKTISTEYWENSYRADEKYVDNYVYTMGTVYIISDGSIHIKQYNSDWQSSLERYGYAWCSIKTDDYKDLLLNLNDGDVVKIKGKVTDLEANADGVTVDIDTYYIEVIG